MNRDKRQGELSLQETQSSDDFVSFFTRLTIPIITAGLTNKQHQKYQNKKFIVSL